MKKISKQVFLNAVACPSLGWLLQSDQEIEGLSYESRSLAEQFRIEQGAEIGQRARTLYPYGVLVQAKRGSSRLFSRKSSDNTGLILKGD